MTEKNKKLEVRKAIILPMDLAQAFLDFEYEQKKAGNKISFQGFVEGLLRTALKKYLSN